VSRTRADRLKISDRLLRICGKRSQRQFARDLGVNQQIINRYLNGITVPQVDFLLTLSVKEDVSADWVLLGRGRVRRRAS
jgi:transcriptional regulator with XRE-family HTH domain